MFSNGIKNIYTNHFVRFFVDDSGWPSFRDQEVVWDNVRVLKNSGETVSVDGTHLGREYFEFECYILILSAMHLY